MGQKIDLETVEPQEIPAEIWVMLYNTISDQSYGGCGEKKKKSSSNRFIYPKVQLQAY